jgi:alkylhydroperoxidase family enzyme
VYDALAAEFTPEEQVQLTLMINVINGWNRIAVGFDLFHAGTPAVTQQAA